MQRASSYPQMHGTNGDEHEEAFAALFRDHAPRLAVFVRMKIRDRDDADDLVSESICQLIAYCRSTDRTITHHRALLFKIARNRIADYYKQKRSSDVPLEEAPEIAAPRSLTGDADARERLREIQVAIARMQEDERELITLHAIVGLEIVEIAELLETTSGNVRTRLYRARIALKEELQNRGGLSTESVEAREAHNESHEHVGNTLDQHGD